MKIIVTGGTGMVGSEVVRQAILDDSIELITLIVRKQINFNSPKVKVIIHPDFLDYSTLTETFRQHDACIWCLGISQNQVDEKQYIIITYDYAVAAAKAMLETNPAISFLFLSGDGASPTEKSRFLFGRIKGKTENALLKMPFKRFFIARPAGILPINKDADYPFALKMQYLFVRIMRFITPSFVITSVHLAEAMLHVIKKGTDHTILTNKDLKQIAKSL